MRGYILGIMSQSMHAFVLESLRSAKGTWPAVAEKTGISKRTIEKIASGEIENPGVSHIEKLANYFRGAASKPKRLSSAVQSA
jgi:transcriptional regulator with XRE-family HTH domain